MLWKDRADTNLPTLNTLRPSNDSTHSYLIESDKKSKVGLIQIPLV